MMICTAECSFRQTVNGVLTASSSPTKHSTDQIQLPHRRAHLLAKRSKLATISNDVKVAALSLPVNMILFSSHRIAWESTHNGSTSLPLLKNQILSLYSTADLPPSGILTTELAGVVTITLSNAGTDPVLRTPLPAECEESLPIHAGPLSKFKQQPQAAKVSTDLVFETWATELKNDPDMDFILDGVKLLSPDSMVSHALRPGAKNQIEAQLVKSLRKRSLCYSRQGQHAHYH